MKNKFLWINLAIGISLFIITGLITAYSIALPIALSQEEIDYYTETAENAWYNGLQSVKPDDDISIKYDLEDKTVRVFARDTAKQSITVDFSNDFSKVTINKPEASFIGCFIFYGCAWTVIITFFASFAVGIIQSRIAKKKSRE